MNKGKSFTRRYHMKAPTSQVEETLFADPALHQPDPFRWIITRDQVRTVRVPSKDPLQDVLHLSAPEWQHILSASQVPMKSEKNDEDIEAAADDELHRQKPRRGMEELYDQILEWHEEKKLQEREEEEKKWAREKQERIKLEDLNAN
ncbi:cilia- and flagella-associated protein 45 isoform X3 [Xyrichtys novacula]|uniref:Cilia- and flagella-associated protein 45 isoform X3 n=1 Tax=Xyrichtys novacula TaxID=13765 RepID=A0AAV1GLU8_XYRNO|nr:cilia- and flagella-associated protein 45 isoform X3 [Xyrichtys novacula]